MEARLWLRVFLAIGSVGVVTVLLFFFAFWFNLSVPQNGFLSRVLARLMLLDFLGVLSKAFEVSDLRSSTGGVRVDLPVGVPGVLKLEGADCFLLVMGLSFVSFSGRVNADLFLLSAGLVGVEVRKGDVFPLVLRNLTPESTGEVLPLIDEALLSKGDTLPFEREVLRGFEFSPGSGEIFPLMEDVLLSIGDIVPGRDSFREVLLLAGEGDVLPIREGSFVREPLLLAGEGEVRGEAGGRVTGSTSRRPCVTRRTWQGSCRDKKCSSVSQPPPTRTIM